MPPSTEPQPAPPGNLNGKTPPLASAVLPGMVKPGPVNCPLAALVPPSSVPPWVIPTFAPVGLIGKAVAIGVPRGSIDRPRLGWLPLTKSRWLPNSALFQLLLTAPITLKPCSLSLPQPAVADRR